VTWLVWVWIVAAVLLAVGWWVMRRRPDRGYPRVCECGRRVIFGPPVKADGYVHAVNVCYPLRETL